MIALLESLGIPAKAFCDLQKAAISSLRDVLTSPLDAAQALRQYGLGQGTKLGQILKGLNGPPMGQDNLNAMRRIPFLRHCVVAAVTHGLRAIKYHCRIPIPDSCILMGIMDETETLKEGQIYVCLRSPRGLSKVLKGKCLIARSPTMHPGDVQIAHAIGEVDEEHPLRALHNCIVFSSEGSRPLQTMLAGGDLDGDLYHVSQYVPIMPAKTHPSGAYPVVQPHVLRRDVEISDVVDFFLDYIETDQLGKIATMHLVQADRSDDGVLDQVCLELAELHSTAVDMAKTGIKPNLNQLSKFIDIGTKPDFMQKEFRIEPDDPDFSLTPSEVKKRSRRMRYWREREGYYRSEKALGQLFRQIDISADIAKWQSRLRLKSDEMSVNEWADPIKRALSRYLKVGQVNLWTTTIGSDHLDLLKEYYVELDSIARDFAPEGRSEYLTEEEIFVGVVIGRGPYMQHNRTFDVMNSLRSCCQTLIRRVLEVLVVIDGRAETTDDEKEFEILWSSKKPAVQGDEDETVLETGGATTDGNEETGPTSQDGAWNDILASEDESAADFSEEVPPMERFKRLAAFFVSAVNYQAEHPDRRSAPWIVMPEILRTMEELFEGAEDHAWK
ncbi:hypothetical protein OC861_002840 [Tilletia horrida]|nr:hypothetical protein OC845_003402 [Tilletia horrida]KAK0567243.1 hypothetical protein OC861_002840 [Tilletia horrida]